MLGSDGQIEASRPVTDDERRDVETHIRGEFIAGLIFQMKSTTYFDHRFKARRLSIHFAVEKDRLISHPLFWYCFAYLDVEAMAFADPVFVVPSIDVHEHAAPQLRGGTWSTSALASNLTPGITGESSSTPRKKLGGTFCTCLKRKSQRPSRFLLRDRVNSCLRA